MPTTRITPTQLEAAAQTARNLNYFLDQAMEAKAMPWLIGFGLDYLAEQFHAAAVNLAGDPTWQAS